MDKKRLYLDDFINVDELSVSTDSDTLLGLDDEGDIVVVDNEFGKIKENIEAFKEEVENTYATKEEVENTYATKESLANTKQELEDNIESSKADAINTSKSYTDEIKNTLKKEIDTKASKDELSSEVKKINDKISNIDVSKYATKDEVERINDELADKVDSATLNDYPTKQEVTERLESKADKTEITQLESELEKYATKEEVPTVQTDNKGTEKNYIYSKGENKIGSKLNVVSDIVISPKEDNVNIETHIWGQNAYFSKKILAATQTTAGVMSAEDKTKLDNTPTEFKTINGTSILGEGDLEIKSGSKVYHLTDGVTDENKEYYAELAKGNFPLAYYTPKSGGVDQVYLVTRAYYYPSTGTNWLRLAAWFDPKSDYLDAYTGTLIIDGNGQISKENIDSLNKPETRLYNKTYIDKTFATKAESDARYGTLSEQQSLRADVENALGEIAELGADKADKKDIEDMNPKLDKILENIGDIETALDAILNPVGGKLDISANPEIKLAYSSFTEVPDIFIGWDKLENGYQMFINCSGLTSFDSELPELTSGYNMFTKCTALTSFNVTELPKMTNGNYMFQECRKLASFDSELPKLTNGSHMFNYCTALTSFNSELPELESGYNMFEGCNGFTSFNIELPELTSGNYMFQNCSGLTSFNVTELPKLSNGSNMFANCTSLTSFNSELPKMTNGSGMFYNCPALTSLHSDLSSLSNPSIMFAACSNLANVTLKGSLNVNITWSDCPLTVDSMLSIMNAMVDLSGQSSKTMTFGATNLAKLSDDQKAIATNKNWVLA